MKNVAKAGRRARCRKSGQLCAPTHWSIRERRGEGVLFRHPWVRYRRASRPARRRHLQGGSMSPKTDTKKSAKSASATRKEVKGFTDEERAAMKERAQE